MNFLRKWFDRILLNDFEWKKKYCPNLYRYLFEMNDIERKELWDNLQKFVEDKS